MVPCRSDYDLYILNLAAKCYKSKITVEYATAPSDVQISTDDAYKLVKPIELSFGTAMKAACNDIGVRFGQVSVANHKGLVSIVVTVHFQGDTFDKVKDQRYYRVCFARGRPRFSQVNLASFPQINSKYPVSKIVSGASASDKLCCQPGYISRNGQCGKKYLFTNGNHFDRSIFILEWCLEMATINY